MGIEAEYRRIALATGVTLNVALAGPIDAEPIIFLHGFPESHRTWRHQFAQLADAFRLIAPDQRGFGGSDRPPDIDAYRTERIVEDLIALADSLDIERFTLVGHDWGGAASWLAALRHPERIARLAIINAPHPLLFQRRLIDDPAQRAASQYIRAFREPAMEQAIAAMGYRRFFEKSFAPHVALDRIPQEERDAYLADWSRPGAMAAMLNWYRASAILVPAPGEAVDAPDWIRAPFPVLRMPVLVVWGLRDAALLPVLLDGLPDLVADLRIVAEPEAGHFIPWERPDVVTGAIRDFVNDSGDAADE